MKEKDELIIQITKHTLMMTKVIANLKLMMKEKAFKELHDLAVAYYTDSKHFFNEKKYVQSFEALIISWAYVDSGLKLGVFKLDKEFKNYFTND